MIVIPEKISCHRSSLCTSTDLYESVCETLKKSFGWMCFNESDYSKKNIEAVTNVIEYVKNINVN